VLLVLLPQWMCHRRHERHNVPAPQVASHFIRALQSSRVPPSSGSSCQHTTRCAAAACMRCIGQFVVPCMQLTQMRGCCCCRHERLCLCCVTYKGCSR
jgi:hypothetical protein